MPAFDGRSVIVTGGAKGIGRAICAAFARDGARVLCADVDADAGQALEADPAGAGRVHFREADVALADACEGLARFAVEEWGGIDVVCNNVGIQPIASYRPAHELSEEQWDRILDVNLKSCFLMTRVCVPPMIAAGGGVIINTASVQGLQSARGVSAYGRQQGRHPLLTRQLALDYAEHGIRVLAVNPGTIDTPLVDEAVAAAGGDEAEMRASMAAAHPLGAPAARRRSPRRSSSWPATGPPS